MGKEVKEALKRDSDSIFSIVIFIVCLLVAIGLLIGGAITPPPFVIDSSILTACSILLSFVVVAMVPKVIKAAKTVKVNTLGGNQIEIEGNNKP